MAARKKPQTKTDTKTGDNADTGAEDQTPTKAEALPEAKAEAGKVKSAVKGKTLGGGKFKGKPKVDPDLHYKLIIKRGEADKLNPNSEGKVYYSFACNDEDNKNYLRIIDNDGGGLHTKEWIPLDGVINLLVGHKGGEFKSPIFKACIVGKSSNNASFLAAILRSPDIKLIQACSKNPYLHALCDDFSERSTQLLAQVDK